MYDKFKINVIKIILCFYLQHNYKVCYWPEEICYGWQAPRSPAPVIQNLSCYGARQETFSTVWVTSVYDLKPYPGRMEDYTPCLKVYLREHEHPVLGTAGLYYQTLHLGTSVHKNTRRARSGAGGQDGDDVLRSWRCGKGVRCSSGLHPSTHPEKLLPQVRTTKPPHGSHCLQRYHPHITLPRQPLLTIRYVHHGGGLLALPRHLPVPTEHARPARACPERAAVGCAQLWCRLRASGWRGQRERGGRRWAGLVSLVPVSQLQRAARLFGRSFSCLVAGWCSGAAAASQRVVAPSWRAILLVTESKCERKVSVKTCIK